MSSFNVFRPYYYGPYKWDNYLLDIQDGLATNADLQRQTISLRRQDFQQMAETTQGLQSIAQEVAQVRQGLQDGFEEMRASFEWGFTLLAERMDVQIQLVSQVVAKLDAIHNILQAPLMTQARELFNLGQERLRKGLWDKALEAFHQAQQKNDVDFLLQLQMGKLLLYGRNKECNVVDPVEAERHLLLAARYADAERESIPGWKDYCGQAYFHAAVAAYLLGGQEDESGRGEKMRECLQRALSYLERAVTLQPKFTESIYTQAKCHALLGDKQEALERFQTLSDRDRRYCAKACRDADFHEFQTEIRELFDRACSAPGSLALGVTASLGKAQEMLSWAKICNAPGSPSSHRIYLIEQELTTATHVLTGLEADLDNLHVRMIGLRNELEDLARDGLQAQVKERESEIISLGSRTADSQHAIEELKQRLNATTGGKTGCIFMVLACVGTAFILAQLGVLLGVSVIVGIVVSFPVYFIVNQFTLSKAEKEIKTQIQEKIREIELCEKRITASRQMLVEAQQQLTSFSSWRDGNPH